jgi:hypothetical protein
MSQNGAVIQSRCSVARKAQLMIPNDEMMISPSKSTLHESHHTRCGVQRFMLPPLYEICEADINDQMALVSSRRLCLLWFTGSRPSEHFLANFLGEY